MQNTIVENNMKWMYTPKDDEQFFFMHIPKTGGTTFRNILSNHFPVGTFYPSKRELIANNGKYYTQKELVTEHKEILKRPLIMGHYNIGLLKFLNPNVKVITMVRNPIDRINSHIEHIKKHDSGLTSFDSEDILKERFNFLVSLQAKMMGYTDKKANMKIVRQNIKKIDCIGIQDRFSDTIKLCNTIFNWRLEAIEKMNISRRDRSIHFSQEMLSELCRSLFPDLHTYNVAYKEFEKRLNLEMTM